MGFDTIQATCGGATNIERDRWGRPMILQPGTGELKAYTRCTTFVGALEDQYNLMAWKQRQTVAGICQRKDLYLRASSLGSCPDEAGAAKTWKAQMNEVCESAMEASGSSSAATTGTALHAFTEDLDRGKSIHVPTEFQAHIDNYKQATAAFIPVMIEAFLVQDEYQIGGTTDRIIRIDGRDGLFIADLKTGTVEDAFSHKFAMQLAVYANSVLYDPATGTRTPIEGINREVGYVIHLDAKTGKCLVKEIDIRAGWDAVELASRVRMWRSRKGLLRSASFLTYAQLIEKAPDRATLEWLWADAKKHGRWDDTTLLPLVKARLAIIEPLQH